MVGRKFFAGREQQEKEKVFLKCKLVGNPLGKESDSQSLSGAGLPVQAAFAEGLLEGAFVSTVWPSATARQPLSLFASGSFPTLGIYNEESRGLITRHSY